MGLYNINNLIKDPFEFQPAKDASNGSSSRPTTVKRLNLGDYTTNMLEAPCVYCIYATELQKGVSLEISD